ncbi:hypothetical protein JCM17846_12620 [Iodidimonas nitroreducens]|uniref:HTH cro/C1-type domain-containing protein n=1 Tax=Iodidimonas nitroreducens TaxID=1236968 RepID=A0A5A7N865_9PROT|nr:hypothetical protein AQ1_02311 [alpha proteobacterium Q-1]GER03580.1 hypothetical protein JCM17846_12620 [Iodidimonas nitroreducens]
MNSPSVETLALLARELQVSMEILAAIPSPSAKSKTARREGLEFSLLAEVDRLNDKQLEALITVDRTYS